MSDPLCIHGHFYQPPREDPWLDLILPEGSAAPFKHWNERICRESYTPLAWARRMNGDGTISRLVNCYEWVSFNFGPTLMRWLERAAPETYEAIIEADKASMERWAHGNAMAQVYHHVIMPLAKERDKRAEVEWAVADFRSRFGRDPEGLWLSETAVDTASLEVLADYGVKFTILAPRQARAVAPVGSDDWREVSEGDVDLKHPYLVKLPSGKSISVFFYNGPVSQAVAFEGLLADGEKFWSKIRDNAGGGLLSIGTDGETYGHHFSFGEMALAYVLEQAMDGRDNVRLTNYGAYLAENPPLEKVRLWENSSWSCVHGVERWRSDCGCCTGGHDGWNQAWRAPLREALSVLKDEVDSHFDSCGPDIFKDMDRAFLDYGRLLAGDVDEFGFMEHHFKPGLGTDAVRKGWKLLAMQKWSLAAHASCAWFFDDIGRIEPVNGLTYALRALELGVECGMKDMEPEVRGILATAMSNDPELGTGRDIWDRLVKPRREDAHSIVSQAVLQLSALEDFPESGRSRQALWPGVSVTVSRSDDRDVVAGQARVRWLHELESEPMDWKWERAGNDFWAGCVRICRNDRCGEFCFPLNSLPWNKRQNISMTWIATLEENQWRHTTERMVDGVDLFLPFQEAQTVQNLDFKWVALWPALTWAFIHDIGTITSRTPDLLSFITSHMHEHPDRELLFWRLDEEMSAMMRALDPDWKSIVKILERIKAIGAGVDFWKTQNTFWEVKSQARAVRRAGALLRFKEDVLS